MLSHDYLFNVSPANCWQLAYQRILLCWPFLLHDHTCISIVSTRTSFVIDNCLALYCSYNQSDYPNHLNTVCQSISLKVHRSWVYYTKLVKLAQEISLSQFFVEYCLILCITSEMLLVPVSCQKLQLPPNIARTFNHVLCRSVNHFLLVRSLHFEKKLPKQSGKIQYCHLYPNHTMLQLLHSFHSICNRLDSANYFILTVILSQRDFLNFSLLLYLQLACMG